MLHQGFHVVVMVGFLVGVALAFLGFAGPLLLGREGPFGLKLSVLIGAVALTALGADWVIHALYRR